MARNIQSRSKCNVQMSNLPEHGTRGAHGEALSLQSGLAQVTTFPLATVSHYIYVIEMFVFNICPPYRKQTQLAEIWRSYRWGRPLSFLPFKINTSWQIFFLRESNPLESSSQHNIRQGMETQASLGLKNANSMGINMMEAGNPCARDTFSALSGRAEMLQTIPGPPSPPMSEPQSWSPWTLGSQSSLGSLGSSSWSSPSPSGCWTPPSSPPMPSLMSPSSPPNSPATQGENHLMENLIKLLHINNWKRLNIKESEGEQSMYCK